MTKYDSPVSGYAALAKHHKRGWRIAEKFGQIAASEGIPEISGYAQGVDARAHLGALKEGGLTVAVIAEGILRFRHKKDIYSDPKFGKPDGCVV